MIRRALHAFPTLLRVGFADAVAYRVEFIIWILTTNMPLVMLALWNAVAADNPVIGGEHSYGHGDFVAYYLCTLLVRLLTGCWVAWELNMEIRQGTLGLRLLRPIHPLVAYAAENLAALPMRGLFTIPLILVLLFTSGGQYLTHDPLQVLMFLVATGLAWVLTFLVYSAIGAMALLVESAMSLAEVWMGLFGVLSGYLIPIDLFPPWLRSICNVLPFRFLLSFPVEILLGRHSPLETVQLLGVQLLYVVVIWAVVQLIWSQGLKRYQAYGG
jgi:ABC-2 type transport system permease protein